MRWWMRGMAAAVIIIAVIAPASAALKVVATTPGLGDIAREIGGGFVNVTTLCRGYQDPHFVDPKPSFIMSLRKADLLILNGLGLEIGWLPPLIESARNGKIIYGADGYLDASRRIVPLEVPSGRRSELRTQGDVHPAGNPHYLLDPENALIVAKELCERLIKIAPEKAGDFRKNLESYTGRLKAKMAEWKKAMAPVRGSEIVTYHRLWSYLEYRFGLTTAVEIEPKPGVPPSPAHVAYLLKYIPESGAKVLVMAPYYSDRVPKLLAKKTGITVLVLPTMPGGVKGTDSYIGMMDYIVGRLSAVLVGKKPAGEAT